MYEKQKRRRGGAVVERARATGFPIKEARLLKVDIFNYFTLLIISELIRNMFDF